MADLLVERPKLEVVTLSLWQPWATLVALRLKWIETRSWTTSYRGPLAIHAGLRCEVGKVGDFDIEDDTPRRSPKQYLMRGPIAWPYRLPLGAVVATCELVDVVPIVDPATDGTPCVVDEVDGCLTYWDGARYYWSGEEDERDVTTQRPFGEFTPGRFAWILADIEPLAEPIPARGRQGLWKWDRR